MADIETVRALTEYMRANKLTRAKMGGIELEMHPSAFPAPPVDYEALAKAGSVDPTEDELMGWSAPNFFLEPEQVAKVNGEA